MQHRPFAIELTSDEATLAAAIKFDPHDSLGDSEVFHANGDLVVQLTNNLFKRKAIPDQRLSYFSDPEYNVGGRGKSRRDSFINNRHDSESIMSHGHFLKYLYYFIYGENLPAQAIQAFSQAVEDCGSITSGDIAPLSATARQLVRTHRLAPKIAAEEFYKLCFDLDLSASDASSIRTAVLQVRNAS